MILIYSELRDVTTNLVIDWLYFALSNKFVRINTDVTQKQRLVEIDNSKNNITFKLANGSIINLLEISNIWFRRGKAHFESDYLNNFDKISKQIDGFVQYENICLHDFYNYLLSSKKSIGSPFYQEVNKLYVSEAAKKLKLHVPETLITTQKETLLNFYNEYKKIVTKSIGAPINFIDETSTYMGFTTQIDNNFITSLPDSFSPSLFQQYIEKKYEIRTFYLCGFFYSMAIFSQNDTQTKVDFRNYNYKKPNRRVPYKLPVSIEKKLKRLMKKLRLDSGSIDIIVTTQNEYYFLEVNPVGQFGMVSLPCNYYLEKEIAYLLSAN